MIHIARLPGVLPDTLPDLAETARSEGVRNLSLLLKHWETGEERFLNHGAALFAAYLGRDVVGVGGATRQEGLDQPAMRMRRFYVAPAARRAGVGARLAEAAITHARQSARLLTVNARASCAAPAFWEAQGFHAVDADAITHIRWCEA